MKTYRVTAKAEIEVEIDVDAESEQEARYKAWEMRCPDTSYQVIGSFWDYTNDPEYELVQQDYELVAEITEVDLSEITAVVELIDESADESGVQS